MESSSDFTSQMAVTRTQMVDALLAAQECVFTVSFRKKVTPKYVSQVFEEAKSLDFVMKNTQELAKDLAHGKEHTITGFLTSSDEKLGRSSVIDLNCEFGKGFRLVDHRTLESLIIKKVKYVLK